MRSIALMATALGSLTLASCGGSEEQPPIEEITIREPGEAVAPVPVAPDAEPASDLVAQGEAAFAVCSACHVAEAGEASMAGPNLHGVVGRAAGMLDDFAYSDALASSGITWTEAELDTFIANPSAKVPGTSMVAGAVSDADRRAAIVAYLASLSE